MDEMDMSVTEAKAFLRVQSIGFPKSAALTYHARQVKFIFDGGGVQLGRKTRPISVDISGNARLTYKSQTEDACKTACLKPTNRG